MNVHSAINRQNPNHEWTCHSLEPFIDEKCTWRVGVWSHCSFTWKFPSSNKNEDLSSTFSVYSNKKGKDHEELKFRLYNSSATRRLFKVIVQYKHQSNEKSLAFYSPAKNAILHYSQSGVVMLGGLLNGKGLTQYCIRDYNQGQNQPIFRCIEEGFLPISPLASGNLCSVFTLETELAPESSVEGMIWTIGADTNEKINEIEARLLNMF
ncbi:hypothetical protein [Peribacillus tepidiphilus]|uniref:hypothetical protein n=1 Tax=Peribacillus tepidiphilus TaxID=2652445 RepID=UPI0035B54002